ncbi:MAG: ABC transporter permease [Muribaculaceae bacterium]|nr:ABC transporter permease [Muribaculaceae bacterium]
MKTTSFISRLLRKNISPARIAGFILSNFIGLAIVLGGLIFYLDARSIWDSEDSFIRSDYLVINKKVTSENTLNGASSFSENEVKEIMDQPWVRKAAPFTASAYRVKASLNQGGRGMSTAMFFEAIPDDYVDVPKAQWSWSEGSDEVPLIISKDYLTLYNFGFASAAGLPQMSEGLMSGIPLSITLSDENGTRSITLHGRVAGYSNRLNTILVPQNFMDWSNRILNDSANNFNKMSAGPRPGLRPSRMIIDVNSPGDVAINKFLESHDYEVAGDKTAASASFLLKLVVGIVLAIGGVITILSLFILMLSVSLLMEKNRDKLHSLLMLGYPLSAVGAPYCRIVISASCAAAILALGAAAILRGAYLEPLRGLGAETGSFWPIVALCIALTAIIIIFNVIAVKKKVRGSWR